MTADQAEFLSEKAAARILDISPRTLRSWRKQGLIGFCRLPSGTIRYTLDDLLIFQGACRVPPRTRRASDAPAAHCRILPLTAAQR